MPQADTFTALCHSETTLLKELAELMQREQVVLVRNEVAALEPLAEEKARLLEQLAGQARQRAALMRQADLIDADRVHGWLADKAAARVAWGELDRALRQVQAINRLNGELVERHLTLTEETLEVLRQAAISTLGYGKDGALPSLSSGGRHLGSA
jgi:flagella synthesis protein FlgN